MQFCLPFYTQWGKILSSCAFLFLCSCVFKRQFQINFEIYEHRSGQKNDTSEVILIHCEQIDIQFFVFPFSDTHFCIQIQTRLSHPRPVLGFAHSIVSLAKIEGIFFSLQCNLDLVTLMVSAKTVTKLHNVTKSNDFM